MIKNEDISVVIQGPVFHENDWTKKSCQSVRNILPGAEIILSTWKNENVDGLDYDILIQSEDPGAEEALRMNLKRQIVSTYYGTLASKRKYVLKMRSESIVTSTAFIGEFERRILHGEQNHFLKERLVIVNTKPSRVKTDMFHIIDWYFFGWKEDMLQFWNIDLVDYIGMLLNKTEIEYNEHRFLFTQFVKKHMELKYYRVKDATKKLQRLHDNIVVENFIIMEQALSYGVVSQKYPPLPNAFDNKMRCIYRGYTKKEWIRLYNKYCGGTERVRRTFCEWWNMYVMAPLYILFKYEGGLSTINWRMRRWIRSTYIGATVLELRRRVYGDKKQG